MCDDRETIYLVSACIYDGTFKPGQGVTAALLRQNGIGVLSEEELSRILE
jgi:uncharacterized protein YbbK (DUF523 family)